MNVLVTQSRRVAVHMDMVLALIFVAQLGGLDSVQKALKHDLHNLAGVRFVMDGSQLNVKYRTTVVKIPKPTKALRRMEEKVPEEQPRPDGFMIEVYEYAHKQTDGPSPKQAARMNANWIRDYGTWRFDAVDRQVRGKDIARFYWLAWGPKVERKLLSQIRSALEMDTSPILNPKM